MRGFNSFSCIRPGNGLFVEVTTKQNEIRFRIDTLAHCFGVSNCGRMRSYETKVGGTKSCTCCIHPRIVTLSNESLESKHSLSDQLHSNLKKYGWSSIRYDEGNLTTSSWKDERFVPLFRCQESFQTSRYSFQYRTNESGGSQQELKQSWEVSFFDEPTNSTMDPLQQEVQRNMVEWFELFHRIAVSLCRHLQLPPNILLEEDPQSQRLDLMRAFFYETAEENSCEDEVVTLGSNPHTDWGSFTIVWQDEVGGLQTYCRSCELWTDVTPVPNTFVVHCSDITSLALQTEWPSPLHRVLSPKHERRASLVYFGYPPRHLSLKNIAGSLSSFRDPQHRQSNDDDSAPSEFSEETLECYSLLQNQALGKGASSAAKHQLERIYNMPIQQIIQDKWQQVQRY
ncbi:hypothetical protein FisN_16Lh265 [Fistulifera solaris]|uniref:Fe2OG dioxygenase domain-containing protein n=1 Tax=Fistulifera solaris TaxID=1519565 RepID=A0A1Z5J6X1_FISSO|nr:hypothetical protein FisN_16Lh265 [Fistulifera solaris]|eukprot:GAX09568.1 hypothetical protein FisN_16Lh265 [Fistulifera solaris]